MRSLQFTTISFFSFVLLFMLSSSYFLHSYLNKQYIQKDVIAKAEEISHLIQAEVESISRLSSSQFDINDILVNHLTTDINYIALYDNTFKPLYKSSEHFKVFNREEFIKKNFVEVMKNNNHVLHNLEDPSVVQVLIRYELRKNKTEILAQRFGVIYFEYSKTRDIKASNYQLNNELLFNAIWSFLLLFILYWFIKKHIISPLTILSSTTNSIAKGMKHITIPRSNRKNKDEIHNLFESIGQMHASLENLNESLKHETLKAHESNKAKSEFLANMSHEIRTPLNAIVGFIERLIKKEQDSEKLKLLKIVNESSTLLLNVINDILDLSKIESGKLEISATDFNPIDEINAVATLFNARCEDKLIVFNQEFNNLPQFVNTDELRMKQILSNILSNAIKFTEEKGSVTLIANYLHDTQTLQIIIEDTGIGMSEEQLVTIFEPFKQSDDKIQKKYGGTGLGLSISKRLCEIMGGRIDVKSDFGKGSQFIINLHAPVAEKEETTQTEKEYQKICNKKILVVEDNKTNQLLLTMILEDEELEYDIANDGVEAVERFKKNKYDLILMDENMPNMNGTEATKIILAYEAQNNLLHTPIVALTANALKGDRERFLDAGMDDYLTKPIDSEKLENVLHKYLNADQNNLTLTSDF